MLNTEIVSAWVMRVDGNLGGVILESGGGS